MFSNDVILNSIDNIIPDYEVYLVGGYLRNFFLSETISPDRDLVVRKNAKEFALKVAQQLDAVFVELDNENLIYRVILKDKKNYFDISQALNNNIDEDIKRRDFTINSIFYDLNKKQILDLSNGIQDIKNKIIKTVDNNNLLDDSLRFLRMYRFMAQTGFKIDKNLEEFTRKNFQLVKKAALERINYEIIKIFEGKYCPETLLRMFDDNTLSVIFPFVDEIKRVPSNSHHHLDLIHHSIETVKNLDSDKALLKIAAFYHDIGKPSTWTIEPEGRHRFIGHDNRGAELAKIELEKLKFSKKQIAYITKMIKYHIYPASIANSPDFKSAAARFVRKLGEDTLDIIALSKADRLSALGEAVSDEMVSNALSHLERLKQYYLDIQSMVKNPESLLNGIEIMKILNLKPSKTVGEIIEKLKELQLEGIIKTKEDAINYIKKQSR